MRNNSNFYHLARISVSDGSVVFLTAGNFDVLSIVALEAATETMCVYSHETCGRRSISYQFFLQLFYKQPSDAAGEASVPRVCSNRAHNAAYTVPGNLFGGLLTQCKVACAGQAGT